MKGKQCANPDCDRRVSKQKLFCGPCFQSLPHDVQRDLMNRWNEYRNGYEGAQPRFQKMLDKAIAALWNSTGDTTNSTGR